MTVISVGVDTDRQYKPLRTSHTPPPQRAAVVYASASRPPSSPKTPAGPARHASLAGSTADATPTTAAREGGFRRILEKNPDTGEETHAESHPKGGCWFPIHEPAAAPARHCLRCKRCAMSCKPIVPKLGPFLDDELATEARVAVKKHLTVCATCRSEMAELRGLAGALSSTDAPDVPKELWPSIVRMLDHPKTAKSQANHINHINHINRDPIHLSGRRPWLLAAAIALFVGLGITGWTLTERRVEASTINFGVLLDALPRDAKNAFDKFLALYDAKPTSVADAERSAPMFLDKTPSTLPGGFRRTQIYLLRFGGQPGVAASYDRDGEFLATVFHVPVKQPDYGTHRDYPCVIGKHHGRRVSVGAWKLVHLSDSTTCHCVLSQLDEESELPAIIAAITSGSNENAMHPKHH